MIVFLPVHSREQLNRLLANYISTYNTIFHTSIDSMPFEHFRNTIALALGVQMDKKTIMRKSS